MSRLPSTLLVAVICLSCGGDPVAPGGDAGGMDAGRTGDAGGPGDAGPPVDAGPLDFRFSTDAPSQFSVQVDHLGLSLISTIALSRSDEANCSGVTNQDQLLNIYAGLVEVHRMWGDEIAARGYTTCMIGGSGEAPTAGTIVDYLTTVPCTTQRINRLLPSGEMIEGPRVIDLITPDFVTIDVDEPGGFPNGRRLEDQVTDQFLAIGTVDMSLFRVDEVTLNIPTNDVPFPPGFPWLAPAHSDVPPRLYP